MDKTAVHAFFVVPRDSVKEGTVAVIQSRVTDKRLTQVTTYLQALRSACTEWRNTTEDGRDAWEECGGRYNIERIVHDGIGPSLKAALEKHGILDLDIACYGMDQPTTWKYDDCLMTPG